MVGIGPASQATHPLHIGPGEDGDLGLSVAADDDLAHHSREPAEQGIAQATGDDEGTVQQFELFCPTPGEDHPILRPVAVVEVSEVLHTQEPLLVEGRGGLVRVGEIAGRDGRRLDPDLIDAVAGHQLERRARDGQADADASVFPPGVADRRTGLGRAVAGDEDEPLPRGAHRDPLQPVMQRLGQARAAEQHGAQLGEEAAREVPIGLQRIGQHRIAVRHGPVIAKRNLLQVPDGLVELARHRSPVVDVEGAAEAGDIGHQRRAGDVAPGQPVEHLTVPGEGVAHGLEARMGVARGHGHGVDHRLGPSGRAGGQQVAGGFCRIEGRDMSGQVRRREADRFAPVDGARNAGRGGDNDCVIGCDRGDGGGEEPALFRIDQAWPDQVDDVTQSLEVGRQQRIVDADRGDRDARHHSGEDQDRVVQRILRQDQDRPVGGHPAIHQPGGDRGRARPTLAVGQSGPVPLRTLSPRQPQPVRRRIGMTPQGGDEVGVVGFQRRPARDDDHPVGTTLDLHPHLSEPHRATGRGGQVDGGKRFGHGAILSPAQLLANQDLSAGDVWRDLVLGSTRPGADRVEGKDHSA